MSQICESSIETIETPVATQKHDIPGIRNILSKLLVAWFKHDFDVVHLNPRLLKDAGINPHDLERANIPRLPLIR